MNKENPYNELEPSDINALIRGMPFKPVTEAGWKATIKRIVSAQSGQSYAAGHASRDEVVDRLVRACRIAIEVIDAEGEDTWPYSRRVIEEAIAKAKS